MITPEDIQAAGIPNPQNAAVDAGWYNLIVADVQTRDYEGSKQLPWKDGPERDAWIKANEDAGSPIALGKQTIVHMELTEGPSAGARIKAYITRVAASNDKGWDGKQSQSKIENMGTRSWNYLLFRLGCKTAPDDELALIGSSGSFFLTRKLYDDGKAKNFVRLYAVQGDPVPGATAPAVNPSPVQRAAAPAGGWDLPPF